MGGKFERYLVPAVIGFAPLVLFLLNWDAEGMSRSMALLREYTVPVFAAELFTIAVALREGMLASWKELRPPKIALVAIAGLLLIAIGTAAFVAPAPVYAIIRTGLWIGHLLFGFSIAFLCGRLFNASDLMRAYLVGFAAFMPAFVIFAAGALERPVNWTFDLPAFTHIRHIGIYATPMIAFCIGIMATERRRPIWAAAFLMAAIGFALVLWTGSRGPVVAIGAALAGGIVIAPAMRRLKAWSGAALSLALAWFAVAWLPVPAENMGALRTVAATTQSGDSLTGRAQIWRGVLNAIEQRPLFGYGEGQMTTVAPFYTLAQPHNLVLQILLAWGIAGLVCALVLFYCFARAAVPQVRKSEAELLGPALAMVALLALSMVDAALYHVLPISIFAACAGVIIAGRRVPHTAR